MRPVLSTFAECGPALPRHTPRLTALLLGMLLLLGGCVSSVPPSMIRHARPVQTGVFIMPDGTVLPYRAWLPKNRQRPRAVVLALHGMNDSRDAWEYPAPDMAAAGIAVFSPDQRGFGATATRGDWAGTKTMVNDVRAMTRVLRHRYPHTRLVLMGESMGAAVLMVAATRPDPPPADGYVIISPAVWSRSEMNLFLRSGLWLLSHAVPGMEVTGARFVHVEASDNRRAIRRLSTDPLTLHATRWSAVAGLVNLMDSAQASAPHFHAPALFMYGGHDQLIPPRATATIWRELPRSEREAFYPEGYHLLLRDLDRITPIEDVIAWIFRPNAPLPSGADRAAAVWLAKQPK